MDSSSSPPRDNLPTEKAMDDKIEAQVNSEVEVQGNNDTEENPEVNPIQRQQQGSLWFKLPPELRNQIYEMLLKVDDEIWPRVHPPSSDKLVSGDKLVNVFWAICSCDRDPSCLKCLYLVPKILRVNKEIYNEAVGILYDHKLYFWKFEDLELFLKTRRPGSNAHPSSITINMQDPHWEVFLHLMGCGVGIFEYEISEEAQEVAPHAFEFFSNVVEYIKSLNGKTVDDSVFTLTFVFTGFTHPYGAGEDWCFVVVRMFLDAVSAKLEELAPNRKFRVAGIVNSFYDEEEKDYRFYEERGLWWYEWTGRYVSEAEENLPT
ncbi:hypothetical protein UCDDS831_g02899 [Diplodia seriata]|uniref:DUF7730 domain-containing protein n=1 Tax=Diplodia seriata TaxID=420778 RepID=A0A0G2GJJ8_9PEZI|nr:hypothetical protein UCDDS831_g02899 [Diplodia seriata]